jgi:hypothetical protein
MPKGRARNSPPTQGLKNRIGKLDAPRINANSSLLAKLITMSMSDFSSRPTSWLQQMAASIGPLGELIYPQAFSTDCRGNYFTIPESVGLMFRGRQIEKSNFAD